MPRPPSRTRPTARLSDADLAPLDDSVHDVARAARSRSAAAGCTSGTTPPTRRTPSRRCSCTASAARRTTGPTSPACCATTSPIDAIDLPGHGRSGPARATDYSPRRARRRRHRLPRAAHRPRPGPPGRQLDGRRDQHPGRGAAARPRPHPDPRLAGRAGQPAAHLPAAQRPAAGAAVLPGLGELGACKRFNARVAPEVRVAGTIALCFADPTRYPEARRAEAVEEARARLEMPWAETAVLRSMRGLALVSVRRAAVRAGRRCGASPRRRSSSGATTTGWSRPTSRLRRRGDPELPPARPRGHRAHRDDGGPGTDGAGDARACSRTPQRTRTVKARCADPAADSERPCAQRLTARADD